MSSEHFMHHHTTIAASGDGTSRGALPMISHGRHRQYFNTFFSQIVPPTAVGGRHAA